MSASKNLKLPSLTKSFESQDQTDRKKSQKSVQFVGLKSTLEQQIAGYIKETLVMHKREPKGVLA